MTNLLLKLRLIFWPFVRLLLVVAAGYAGVVWLLAVALGATPDLSFLSQYWKVLGISSVAILLFLRPRIHLLRVGKNERLRMLFYLLALLAISVAAGSAADALVEGSRSLVGLNSVNDLPRHAGHHGYTLRECYVAKTRITVEKQYSNGKKGTTLTLFLTAPLLRTAADTLRGGTFAWLGITDQTTEPERSSGETAVRFREFTDAAIAEFQLRPSAYLVRVSPSPGLLAAVRRHPAGGQLKSDPVIFVARHEPFSQRASMPLGWLIRALPGIVGVFLLFLLCFPLNHSHLQRYQETGRFPTDIDGEALAVVRFLRPRPGFRLTPLLLALNLAVFGLMAGSGLGVMEFGAPDLVRWGATSGPAVRAGEWWRLLTGAFVHAGLLHLLHNLWGLGFAGWALERVVGGRRLGLVYGFAALAGGLISLWWRPDGLSVGASGGIMGLYGFGLVLTWRAKGAELPVELAIFRTVAGLFVIVSVLLGIAQVRIDGAAHLGGLAMGILLGGVCVPGVPLAWNWLARWRFHSE